MHQPRKFDFSATASSRLQQHLNDLSIRSGASGSGGDPSNTTRHLANATSSHPMSDDLSVISELKTPETTTSTSGGARSIPFTGHKVKEFR